MIDKRANVQKSNFDADGVMVPGKSGICDDERRTTYKGPGTTWLFSLTWRYLIPEHLMSNKHFIRGCNIFGQNCHIPCRLWLMDSLFAPPIIFSLVSGRFWPEATIYFAILQSTPNCRISWPSVWLIDFLCSSGRESLPIEFFCKLYIKNSWNCRANYLEGSYTLLAEELKI